VIVPCYDFPMPQLLIATNWQVDNVLSTLGAALNVGHTLRLFSNNIFPHPSMQFADFQESSFPGYARWSLDGQFAPTIKVQDGHYAMRTVQHVFTCTGASPFAVYGWWMVKDGLVKFAFRFPTLVSLGPGVEIPVKVTIEALSLSLLGS